MKIFCAFILLTLPLVSYAPPSNAQFFGNLPLLTIKDLEAKEAEIKDLSDRIPSNQIIAFEESKKLEEFILRIQQVNAFNTEGLKILADLQRSRDGVSQALTTILALDCQPASEPNFVRALNQIGESQAITIRVQALGGDLQGDVNSLNTNIREIFAELYHPQYTTKCTTTKESLSKNLKGNIEAAFNKLIESAKNRIEDNKAFNDRSNKTIEVLQKRRQQILDRLGGEKAQIQVVDNLPWIILIIGLSCLGAIALILKFPEKLQIEWVISGQVIQFVTVMILLSGILALGLASVLKENTLGTLLGGIAGYVLAQGVGRAAAREATRTTTEGSPIVQQTPQPNPINSTGPVGGSTN